MTAHALAFVNASPRRIAAVTAAGFTPMQFAREGVRVEFAMVGAGAEKWLPNTMSANPRISPNEMVLGALMQMIVTAIPSDQRPSKDDVAFGRTHWDDIWALKLIEY
jgi:hypothetical protein